MTDNRLRLTASLLCLLFVAAGAAAGQKEDWRGYPFREWPLAGRHFGQTRHSSSTQITPDNLDRLGGAWVVELSGGEVSRSTGVVRDGLLFLNTGRGIRALDAATGEEHWRHAAQARRDGPPAAGAGPAAHGAAVPGRGGRHPHDRARSSSVALDAAGEHGYVRTEHPWTLGQLAIE